MAAETPRCYAVKQGAVTLTCELDEGHDGWHKAVYTDRREAIYQGAHHVAELTETVTWEPVDHVREAVKHVMATGKRDG